MLALLALLAPATAQAGTFSISGTTIIYDAAEGDSDQIAGFDVGSARSASRASAARRHRAGRGLQAERRTEPRRSTARRAASRAIRAQPRGRRRRRRGQRQRQAAGHLRRRRRRRRAVRRRRDRHVQRRPRERQHRRPRRSGRDQVDCGADSDTAITDDADTRISCEEVEGDADGDGVRVPADCDDTRPTIRPGATDVPDNGIDEDCSGVDAVDADRDRDGTPRPAGLQRQRRRGPARVGRDDRQRGRRELRRPDRSVPADHRRRVPRLGTARSGTVNLRLEAKRFARNTAIEMRCDGRRCPFDVVRRRVSRAARPSTCTGRSATACCRAGPRSRCGSRSPTGSGASCATRSAVRATRPTSSSCACRPAGGRAAAEQLLALLPGCQSSCGG